MNRSLAIAAHCDAAESAGDRGFRAESVQGPWAGPSWSIQGRHWPEGVCTRPVPARPSHKASALWGKPGRVSLYKAGTSPAESGPGPEFSPRRGAPVRRRPLCGARRTPGPRPTKAGTCPAKAIQGRLRPSRANTSPVPARPTRSQAVQCRNRPFRVSTRPSL